MKPLDAFIQRNILSTDQNYQKGMRPDAPDPKTGLVSLGHSLNAIEFLVFVVDETNFDNTFLGKTKK